METTLSKNTVAFLRNGIDENGKLKTVARQHQKYFLTTGNLLERGLRNMIDGVEEYCVGYEAETDSEYKVGDDGYTGEYVREILHGLRGLLSSLGKFDGGTLDKTIREIASQHNIDLE